MKRTLTAVCLVLTFAAGVAATTVYQSKFDDLRWHCSGWEPEWKVGVGSHPAIVLFAERSENETSDRQVCFATLASDE